DPMAMIIVDEQSVIFTAGYAQQHGIWPRQVQPQPGGGAGTAPVPPGGGGLFGPGAGPISSPGGSPGFSSGGSVTAVGPGQKQFTAQGILREALIKLWEQARAAKVAKISAIEIQMYEAGDAFKLLG